MKCSKGNTVYHAEQACVCSLSHPLYACSTFQSISMDKGWHSPLDLPRCFCAAAALVLFPRIITLMSKYQLLNLLSPVSAADLYLCAFRVSKAVLHSVSVWTFSHLRAKTPGARERDEELTI